MSILRELIRVAGTRATKEEPGKVVFLLGEGPPKPGIAVLRRLGRAEGGRVALSRQVRDAKTLSRRVAVQSPIRPRG